MSATKNYLCDLFEECAAAAREVLARSPMAFTENVLDCAREAVEQAIFNSILEVDTLADSAGNDLVSFATEAKPAVSAPAAPLNAIGYHPEMGESAPANTLIHARLAHYGRHWFLRSKVELSGRGVEFTGVERTVENGGNLVNGSKFDGWRSYKITSAAFERIQREYPTAFEMLL